MGIKYIDSQDTTTWSSPGGQSYASDDGYQLEVYRGQLWGAYRSTYKGYENKPYCAPFKNFQSNSSVSTKSAWRTGARVSVTVLNDVFWMVHRGGSKIYLGYSTDPTNANSWTSVDTLESGKKDGFAKAPTICAFDGNLFVYSPSDNNGVWYTRLNANGKQIDPWKQHSGWGTSQAVALGVYQNALYITHVGGPAFYTSKLTSRDGTWGANVKSSYATPKSAPSMVSHSDGKFYLVCAGNGDRLVKFTFKDSVWSSPEAIGCFTISGQPGIASHDARLYVSVNLAKNTAVCEINYESEDDMAAEKHVMHNQWDTFETPAPKRWYRRLLCSS